jgi:hypothetical protein
MRKCPSNSRATLSAPGSKKDRGNTLKDFGCLKFEIMIRVIVKRTQSGGKWFVPFEDGRTACQAEAVCPRIKQVDADSKHRNGICVDL